MQNMKKMISLVIIATFILSILACLPVSAASKADIVKDGLVIWYDASNNSNGIQDHESTVWKDLTGNGNHMTVKLNETNYWTDNAFHVDANPTYFPDAAVEVANGETYTIEMVLGEVSFTATDWVTLMASDNDEFALFVRQETDELEYKYNDKNTDRPIVADGGALINNATLTITFDLSDPLYGECIVYVNGVAVDTGVPTVTNIADTLMWGHDNPQRVWGGDVYGFRFYDRVLSPEEVADNASADNHNYRNGTYFEPTVEYEGTDEDIAGVDLSKYKNDVIVLDEFTDLAPAIGEYGCTNAHNLHFYGEHQGIKVMPTTNDDGTITGNPFLYVNYSKYVRRIGLENLTGDAIKYVAVKIKVVGQIEDLEIWGLAGENHSINGVQSLTADNWPKCDGSSEYMLFNMEDAWTGLIDKFAFLIVNPAADAVVYIEEIALFADQAGAYAYANMEIPSKDPETTKAPETNAPDADTNAATQAPAVTTGQTTEPAKSGCGAVVGFGVVAVLAAAAAFVARKKN